MRHLNRPLAWLAALATAAGLAALPAVAGAPAHADVAAKGGDYVAVSPRLILLDTRVGTGAAKAKVAAGKTITVTALGSAGIPTSGVRSVLLNVTAISPATATFVTVWPSGTTQPTTSNFNAPVGDSVSSSVLVPLGSDGKIVLGNHAGSLDLVAAVEGYFTSATAGSGPGGYIPVTEQRLVATTTGTLVPKAKIAAGKSVTATLTGSVIPAGAVDVYGTIQVGNATASGGIIADAAGIADSHGVMAYRTGNTTSAVMIKLSTSGQAVFVNTGGAAIDLYFDVQGYIAPDSAHGAGYRSSTSTPLLTAVSMPGSSDLDIQVAGRGGVPTRGAAAAVLDFSAAHGIANGYLRAWPVDGTPPPGGAMLAWAPDTRSAQSIVPMGVSGKIRIHNYSTAAATIYVEVKGWFDTGEAHDVAIAPHSATAVLQSVSGGSVDAGYVNAGGVLFHGLAGPDALDQAQWSPVASNLEAFTGQPSIVRMPSGNLLVSLLHARDGEVWSFQVAAGATSWTPTFTHTAGIMASAPVSANLPDGSVLTFAVDAGGSLWVLPSTGSTYWQDLGAAGLVGAPTVVTTSDGVQIAAVTTAGHVSTASYTSGALSTWTDLGGVAVTDKTAAVVNNGPRVRIVARQGDGTVISKLQNLNGSFPATWTPAGTPAQSPTFAGAPAVGIDQGTGTNPGTGKAFIIGRATDGYLYEVDETSAASGVWGEWSLAGGQANPAGTDATVTAFGGGANNYHWIATYLDNSASPKILHASAQ